MMRGFSFMCLVLCSADTFDHYAFYAFQFALCSSLLQVLQEGNINMSSHLITSQIRHSLCVHCKHAYNEKNIILQIKLYFAFFLCRHDNTHTVVQPMTICYQ